MSMPAHGPENPSSDVPQAAPMGPAYPPGLVQIRWRDVWRVTIGYGVLVLALMLVAPLTADYSWAGVYLLTFPWGSLVGAIWFAIAMHEAFADGVLSVIVQLGSFVLAGSVNGFLLGLLVSDIRNRRDRRAYLRAAV